MGPKIVSKHIVLSVCPPARGSRTGSTSGDVPEYCASRIATSPASYRSLSGPSGPKCPGECPRDTSGPKGARDSCSGPGRSQFEEVKAVKRKAEEQGQTTIS